MPPRLRATTGGETSVILLTPPLPSAGGSIETARGGAGGMAVPPTASPAGRGRPECPAAELLDKLLQYTHDPPMAERMGSTSTEGRGTLGKQHTTAGSPKR